jgi:hypothetical protein
VRREGARSLLDYRVLPSETFPRALFCKVTLKLRGRLCEICCRFLLVAIGASEACALLKEEMRSSMLSRLGKLERRNVP